MMVVALDAVVETWIDKDLGTDPLVETEGEGVLPFQFGTLIAGVSVEAHLPLEHVHDLPCEVDGELRTEVVLEVMVGVHAESVAEREFPRIFHVVGEGSEMDRSLEAMVEEVGVVVHTEREVKVQRCEEVGI